MMRLRRLGPLAAAASAFMPGTHAFAQAQAVVAASNPFAAPGKGDLAQAWLDYLFRGDSMPDALASYAAPLSFAADGLREAMGIYSVGMLILAAMLVFYHLAAMVVETAQTGVPFGRRANQVWMPIRFVLAIGFLVPVSSSLSAGQYLVIRIAEEGSALASNAWSTVVSLANGHLSGLAAPHGPDVARFVASGVEMEICRAVYQQLYAPLDSDTSVHLAGTIGDITHIPADRFMPETWRYTNLLDANVPLCGEYRFAGYRRAFYTFDLPPDIPARMAEDAGNFAHTQASDLLEQTHTLGDRTASVFLSPAAPIGADVHDDIATLQSRYSDRLETERRQLGELGAGFADQALVNSTAAGWLAAASFIPEFVRLQTSYGSLVDHALPDTQTPVLAYPHLAMKALEDAAPFPAAYAQGQTAPPDRLPAFYGQNARVDAQVHAWLYGSQLPDRDFVPAAAADFTERLHSATDPGAVNSFLAQAFDSSAISAGVWGEGTQTADTGYPFAAIPAAATYNPFAALVEFGRRQAQLASSLASLAASGLTTPNAAGPAILFGIASLLFFLGGVVLIFAVPLLPFLRFLLAALGWGINVFEAAVAVPIVALAHLTPIGGGLSGSLARQAYMLWLGLFVRPVLIVFGFVFGLLLFTLGVAFLDAVLAPFARLAVPSNGGLLIGANMGLVLLYDILVFAAANASFRGISWLPDQALRWTSMFVVTDAHDAASPSTSIGAGPGYSSVTAFLAPGGAPGGGANVNVEASASGTPAGYGPGINNAMTAALFPAYGDRAAAADHALGATTGTPAAATHFSDRSPGGSGSVNVHLTSPGVTVVTPRGSKDDPARKSRFTGGEHEATMGGKERGEKDGTVAAPQEAPKGDAPKE